MKTLFDVMSKTTWDKTDTIVNIVLNVFWIVFALVVFFIECKQSGKRVFPVWAVIIVIAINVVAGYSNVVTFIKKDAERTHYEQLLKEDKVITVQGTVENFVPTSSHNSFSIDGVDFKIKKQNVIENFLASNKWSITN